MTAFGQGSVRAEPDHAVLRLAVNRLNESPKTSLGDAKTAVTTVRRSLRSHGIADVDVMSSQIRVHSAWHGHGAERHFLGHQCRVELSVRIGELDSVESVLVDAVEAGADEILGVVYDTSRTADLRAEAREEAVATAHLKAKLYAEAANIRLGPIVHIEDVDPERTLVRPAPMGVGVGDDLAPGLVSVSAAVILGFAIIR